METGNDVSTNLELAENMTMPMESVEGTNDCPSCQRYMKLGEADLCLTITEDRLQIAEIVGWAPGKCGHFTKAVSPFEV